MNAGVYCALKIAIYGQKSMVGRNDIKNEAGRKRRPMSKKCLGVSGWHFSTRQMEKSNFRNVVFV